MSTDTWAEKVAATYAEQNANGLHDEDCEYDIRGFYLCHCSKRRREAKGIIGPGKDLIFQYPICPRCDEEVDPDGDGGFDCEGCNSHFNGYGEWVRFDDEYGDDLAGDRDKWRAGRARRQAEQAAEVTS